MTQRPALDALADRLGVAAGYASVSGGQRAAADAARVAVLATMGFDASTEQAARRALAILEREAADQLIEPAHVARATARPPRVRLRVAGRGPVSWRVELVDERGGSAVAEGRSVPRHDGRLAVSLPTNPGPGYHSVRVELETVAGELRGEQRLILVPSTCHTIRDALGSRRGFGMITNLYSVRSRRSWGIGDTSDLAALVEWAAGAGAVFVGLNPLHALKNRGWGVSPYSPVSRLFRNVLYLDPEAVPELAECADAQQQIASSAFRGALDRLRATARVDYEAVLALKWPVLESLYGVFAERHEAGHTDRGRAYARYCREQGPALVDFATFVALEAHFAGSSGSSNWREWPPDYRDPHGAAVRAFQSANRASIGMHCYLQFELDRQLADAARHGRQAGLAVGVYQDLAVGTDGQGSDPWAFPGLFAAGASVGAPPDDYSASGQDWGFPPVDPRALARGAYAYWIQLLRAAFAHSGALRIDHAMGLSRLFWVPRGRPASDGCYVRYPARDLLGILALESRRHRAFVIGEDLGTVPRGFASVLARWGILSSRVLYFERDPNGAFRPPSRYSSRAIVTATTHDHPPLVGYRRSRDLELRRAAGQIASDANLETARKERDSALTALCERLAAEGLWPADGAARNDVEFVAAVHSLLARTPAPLIGVYLDDLAQEVDSVNLPGVGPDRYSSWTRRQRLALEQLRSDPDVKAALGDLVSLASD